MDNLLDNVHRDAIILWLTLLLIIAANLAVIVTIYLMSKRSQKDRVECTGCEVLVGVCNVNLWLAIFTFFSVSENSAPKAVRWSHCAGFNTILQIASCVYNICLCQALLCKPLQYLRQHKDMFPAILYRNAMFVLMPTVILIYWLVTFLRKTKSSELQIYAANAAVMKFPGYAVIFDPTNDTQRPGDDNTVIVDCFPGDKCVFAPDSFTFCPERVYRVFDLVVDYLILVLPVSLPILWGMTRNGNFVTRVTEVEAIENTEEGYVTSDEASYIGDHNTFCVYRKLENVVCFLLELNFLWQFLFRPILLMLYYIKKFDYFVDLANRLICTWIIILVPTAVIFRRYYIRDPADLKCAEGEPNRQSEVIDKKSRDHFDVVPLI